MKYGIKPRTSGKLNPETSEVRHQFMLVVGTSAIGRKYLTIDICESLERWDSTQEVFVYHDNDKKSIKEHFKNLNATISAIKTKCDNIILKHSVTEPNKVLTPTTFINLYNPKITTTKIEAFWLGVIDELMSTGHIGNANCYKSGLGKIKVFDPKFATRNITDIDKKYVERYELWMQKPRSTTYSKSSSEFKSCRVVEREPNDPMTRLHSHRVLRAVLNRARVKDATQGVNYPYGRKEEGLFSLSGLHKVTKKRYIPTGAIQPLKKNEVNNQSIETARKIFVALYLCNGIAWVDAAHLTTRNIVVGNNGKYIEYTRAKTFDTPNPKIITIKITDELQGILDWFRDRCELVDSYIFPIVSVKGYKGAKLYNHIRGRLNTVNGHIKKLGDVIGVESLHITSYVARHTMAMRLRGSGISDEKIAQTMGHKDVVTTQVYLDSFSNEELAEETSEIL